jgi:hypothetical protein
VPIQRIYICIYTSGPPPADEIIDEHARPARPPRRSFPTLTTLARSLARTQPLTGFYGGKVGPAHCGVLSRLRGAPSMLHARATGLGHVCWTFPEQGHADIRSPHVVGTVSVNDELAPQPWASPGRR